MNQLIANQGDPTRTTGLRNQFTRKLNQVWQRVQEFLSEWFGRDSVSRLSRAQQIARLRRELDDSIARAIREVTRNVDSFIEAAYIRGLRMANADLNRARYTNTDNLRSAGDESGLASQPMHREEIEALQDGYLTDLDTIGTTLSSQLVREYRQSDPSDDDSRGALLAALLLLLRKAHNTRTRVLAQTATVDAFNTALLARFQQVGVEVVEMVEEYLFTTAGDNRVCIQCRTLARQDNGRGPGIYTIAQSRGVIPVHGLCRCRWRLASQK